jgi:multiple sugar transport system ATP-binding protein
VFLFDEPLSNLDAKLRIETRTELNKLHDRVGKPSVYVTHDQAEAMTLADRVVVMRDGEIQQVDQPEVVYGQPANRFVAGFIGEPPMNFFDATASPVDGRLRVRTTGFELLLSSQTADAVAAWGGDTERIEPGVRPESFEDAACLDDPVADSRAVEAEVGVVEAMGAHKDLTVRPEGGDETDEFTARVSNETRTVKKSWIRLAVDTDGVSLFDQQDGEALF